MISVLLPCVACPCACLQLELRRTLPRWPLTPHGINCLRCWIKQAIAGEFCLPCFLAPFSQVPPPPEQWQRPTMKSLQFISDCCLSLKRSEDHRHDDILYSRHNLSKPCRSAGLYKTHSYHEDGHRTVSSPCLFNVLLREQGGNQPYLPRISHVISFDNLR